MVFFLKTHAYFTERINGVNDGTVLIPKLGYNDGTSVSGLFFVFGGFLCWEVSMYVNLQFQYDSARTFGES